MDFVYILVAKIELFFKYNNIFVQFLDLDKYHNHTSATLFFIDAISPLNVESLFCFFAYFCKEKHLRCQIL